MYFKLSDEPEEITIEILDKEGNVIRNYTKQAMALNFGTGEDLKTGLNKFVWDMRINRVSTVPKRPPTAIAPIVPPGTYTAKLSVDGVVEKQDFEVKMSPKESYTQEQADAKFAFWMEMYNVAEISTQNVIAALAVRDKVNEEVEAMKTVGAKENKIKKAQEQADVIAKIIGDYEGTYVSTGRTLAEVINLPATILFKMSFMSGILDHSEGPVTQSMKAEFQILVDEAKAADDKYKLAIEPELKKFEKLTK